ncbi:hypothetical protein SAMN04488559_13014 [Isobaculum melis]|uniref:DUF4044 domain-containing protein n=1 Tax=Isobaculum melis TaxID=142588 RepID=A0A1H9UHL2_9LACT|nr:hypothetical protein SAMN04488559_13014 [Isobaculum melis]
MSVYKNEKKRPIAKIVIWMMLLAMVITPILGLVLQLVNR